MFSFTLIRNVPSVNLTIVMGAAVFCKVCDFFIGIKSIKYGCVFQTKKVHTIFYDNTRCIAHLNQFIYFFFVIEYLFKLSIHIVSLLCVI